MDDNKPKASKQTSQTIKNQTNMITTLFYTRTAIGLLVALYTLACAWTGSGAESRTYVAILLLVLAGYAYVTLKERKKGAMGHNMALVYAGLYAIGLYVLAEGRLTLITTGALAYFAVDGAMHFLARHKATSRGIKGGKPSKAMIQTLAALLAVTAICTPLLLSDELSTAWLWAYYAITAWPIIYYGRLPFVRSAAWDGISADRIVLGKSLSVALLIVAAASLTELSKADHTAIAMLALDAIILGLNLAISVREKVK